MLEKKIVEWKEDFVRYCGLRKLTVSTTEVYWGSVHCFIWHFNTVNLERISWREIGDYILRYDSSRTMEQKKYSIQLFYQVCIGQPNKCANIPIPKREHKIPEVLNIIECYSVFLAIDNIKQRCAIQTTYACALRMSETRNLRISDIDFTANFVHVKDSKGAKDRVIPLPVDTKNLILEYFVKRFPVGYTGQEYLFDGQEMFKGKKMDQYSATSLRIILKKACFKIGITKKIKFHSLRHSRATHWHNSGVMTLRDIADLLGHYSTKTTEIYIHTQNEDLQDKVTSSDEIIHQKAQQCFIDNSNQQKLLFTQNQQ